MEMCILLDDGEDEGDMRSVVGSGWLGVSASNDCANGRASD